MAIQANCEVTKRLAISFRVLKYKQRPYPDAGSPNGHFAEFYASRGMPVFPVRPGRKDPLTSHGFKDASAMIGQVQDDWRLHPEANIGFKTGHETGITVIDVDKKNGGLDSLAVWEGEYGPLPPTPTSNTGGGGKQFCFKSPEGMTVRNSESKLAPGIDVRGHGGYVVVPPSLHPSGRTYQWAEGLRPDEVELAEMPTWLVEKLKALEVPRAAKTNIIPFPTSAPSELEKVRWRPYGLAALQEACEIVVAAPPGERNATLYLQALKMGSLVGAGALEREEVETAFLAAAPLDSDFDEAEAWRTIQSGLNNGEQNPRDLSHVGLDLDDTFPLNEGGNAERFVASCQDKAHFIPEYGEWYTFTGTHWERGRAGAVMAMREVIKRLIARAEQLMKSGDENDRKLAVAIKKHADRSYSAQRIEGALKLASAFPAIRMSKSDLDPDPMRLNVRNGTLDLRNGHLHPHDQGDRITKIAAVTYDEKATCPTWERFVSEIMGGNEEMVRYLQRLIGYCLTGQTSEQKLFIFFGSGRNGKSVLLSVLLALLGDYGAETPASTLMVKRQGGGIPNDVARLERPHLVSANETDDGASLDESLIKSLTGGDRIASRYLYGEFFEFTPRFKPILRTNNLPRIKGQDEGIWRRLVPVPFEVTIPDDRVDRHLTEKLLAELPGILNWAIGGCLDWQRHGLGSPERLVKAWREYRYDQDSVSMFVASRHSIPPSIGALDFHNEYVAFCQDHRLRSLTQVAFGRRLTDLGWGQKEVKQGGKSTVHRVPPADLVRDGAMVVWEEERVF